MELAPSHNCYKQTFKNSVSNQTVKKQKTQLKHKNQKCNDGNLDNVQQLDSQMADFNLPQNIKTKKKNGFVAGNSRLGMDCQQLGEGTVAARFVTTARHYSTFCH